MPTSSRSLCLPPARMHFWVSVARLSFASGPFGSAVPRKQGLNWFIPALAKRRVGSSWGTTGEDGTTVCSLPSKKSRKVCRILWAGHSFMGSMAGVSRSGSRDTAVSPVLADVSGGGGDRRWPESSHQWIRLRGTRADARGLGLGFGKSRFIIFLAQLFVWRKSRLSAGRDRRAGRGRLRK